MEKRKPSHINELFIKLVGDSAGENCEVENIDLIYNGAFSEVWKGTLRCGPNNREAVVKLTKFPPDYLLDDTDALEREYHALTHFHTIFEPYDAFSTPRPIALSEDGKALALEAVKGESLMKAITDLKPWKSGRTKRVGQYMELTGKMLSVFQKGRLLDKTADMSSETEWRRSRLDELFITALKGGMNRSMTQRAVDVGKRLAGSWGKSEVVNVHGDFTPWNIMIRDGSIVLLDFTQHHLGDPEEDLSLMYCNLFSLARFVWQKGKIEWLRKCLVDGFGRPSNPAAWLYWRISSILYLVSWLGLEEAGTVKRKIGASIITKLYEVDLSRVLFESEVFLNDR